MDKKPKIDNNNASNNIANANQPQSIDNSTTNKNDVKVIDELTANNFKINLTTNVIIASGDAAEIVGSIMAKDKEMQKKESKKTE